jgi:hypothetical protein
MNGIWSVFQNEIPIFWKKGECIMADKTKLASTFEAWRIIIGPTTEHLDSTMSRCEDLGLQPKPCGYQEQRVCISVTIPCHACPIPEFFINEYLPSFHVALFHAIKVKLICPPNQD